MLAIQLDDRALFLARWRDLLLRALAEEATGNHADRQEVRRLVENWSGRAAIDDPGYLIVRTFRRAVLTSTFGALVAPARAAYPDLNFEPGQQFEGSAWQLVTERPQHLLDPRFGDWGEALLEWLDVTIAELKAQCGELSSCNWGRDNSLVMRHPLSRALPWAGWLIDMPSEPLPGDSNMPRVQGRRQGASERIVVSPGRESEGYFQMPGGQSSHPLSPWFRSDHDAWVSGRPQPLLPGASRHTLRLVPDGSG
jgi:penicillin amidase